MCGSRSSHARWLSLSLLPPPPPTKNRKCVGFSLCRVESLIPHLLLLYVLHSSIAASSYTSIQQCVYDLCACTSRSSRGPAGGDLFRLGSPCCVCGIKAVKAALLLVVVVCRYDIRMYVCMYMIYNIIHIYGQFADGNAGIDSFFSRFSRQLLLL